MLSGIHCNATESTRGRVRVGVSSLHMRLINSAKILLLAEELALFFHRLSVSYRLSHHSYTFNKYVKKYFSLIKVAYSRKRSWPSFSCWCITSPLFYPLPHIQLGWSATFKMITFIRYDKKLNIFVFANK